MRAVDVPCASPRAPSLPRKETNAAAFLHVWACPVPCCLQEETGVPCECNEQVGEMLRGVRQHFAT